MFSSTTLTFAVSTVDANVMKPVFARGVPAVIAVPSVIVPTVVQSEPSQ